jgi:sec-independent protein translocase protein TatC
VRFVGPALTTREKRGLIPFCFSALILFLAGATLAFLWLTPMSIKVWHHFASGMGIAVTWQASDYFGFVIMMSLLTGLSFQFPLALIILMWLEIVRPITLLRKWRIMLFCIVLIVALITPIGDPISLLILSSILFSFYLIAVYIGSIIVRRKRIARGDTPYPDDDSDLYDLDDEDEEDEDLKVPPARPVKPKEGPPSPPGDIRSLD